MDAESLSRSAIQANLVSPRFLAGVARGQWRVVNVDLPILIIAVASLERDGRDGSYDFRFETSGFPGQAPEVRIWDLQQSAVLAPSRRPSGSPRVAEAFKHWGDDTVYRPWDRRAGAHGNWPQLYPQLVWHPNRGLAFILEDLHGLLTSNGLAIAGRPAA